jgi:hypothetical protein
MIKVGLPFMRRWIVPGTGIAIALSTLSPAGAAERKPATPAKGPAVAVEDWAVRTVRKNSGDLDYCAAGTRFDNKYTLAVAGNPGNEVMLILALPEDKLKPNDQFDAKLAVDGKERRQIRSLATKANVAVIPLGTDRLFFEVLRRGNVLAIDIPGTSAALTLRGSGKALGDLRTCLKEPARYPAVDEPQSADSAPTSTPAAGAAPPVAATSEPSPATAPAEVAPAQVAATQVAATQVTSLPPNSPVAPAPANPPAADDFGQGDPLPSSLVAVLSAAGMPGVVPISLQQVPVDQRPAIFRLEIRHGVRRRPRIQHHRQPWARRPVGSLHPVAEKQLYRRIHILVDAGGNTGGSGHAGGRRFLPERGPGHLLPACLLGPVDIRE